MDQVVMQELRAAFIGRLIVEEGAMARFLTGARDKLAGRVVAVAEPDTAADVAALLRICDAHGVAVVSHEEDVDLVGGSLAERGQPALVLSLSRLNRIRAVDPLDDTITVEAGCTLQHIQAAAHEAGRLFPLSLATGGGRTIGSCLAANTGGAQGLRFGNMRDACCGLELVTPQGELWNSLRGLRRGGKGYGLRELYIGAENTLGIITAAVLTLQPLPAARVAAFVALPSLQAAVALFALARGRLDASLSAFELVSASCLDLVLRHQPDLRSPLESEAPWYALLEASAMWGEHEAAELMESVLEEAADARLVLDADRSCSAAQFQAMWALCENIEAAQAAEDRSLRYDIALPVSALPEFVDHTQQAILALHPRLDLMVSGHVGNGSLHYALSVPARCGDAPASGTLEAALDELVHAAVPGHGGSIVSTHRPAGTTGDMALACHDEVERGLMRLLKEALDPKGLMNPGKLVF